MRLKIKNISIRTRIYFVISIFLVSALISILIINQYRKALHDTNESLKLALTTQKKISQLSEKSGAIFNYNIYDLRDQLTDLQEDIDFNLNVLVNGGKIRMSQIQISKAKEAAKESGQNLLDKWQEVKSLLTPLHQLPVKIDSSYTEEMIFQINDSATHVTIVEKAILVKNPDMAQAVAVLTNGISTIDAQFDLFINDLNEQTDEIYLEFKFSFFVIGLINLLVFALAFYWLKSTVLSPLKQIGKLAKKVSQGDLDVQIRYSKTDEIGDISTAINSLAAYLNNASSFVHNIGEGNLERRFEGIDESTMKEGSLAHSLISMKQKLKNVASEDKKRNWTTEGLAQFAEILRKNNTNLQELGDAVMAALVPYTKSNQGCMYVAHGEGEQLKLKSTSYYAYDSKKFIENNVDLGEGLVGQTFLEKKTIHLLEIPEEYMSIKSGLGGMKANAILVVPLIVNEEAYGIIELSTFNSYEDYQIEFVEKLSETIASAIASVKNNEQTQKLLQESQQLTEQMRSQEEEMRQNMEELSATQEEMARKEAQTASTIKAIESSLLTAQLDMNGIITQANLKMLLATGYNAVNQLIGTSLFDLLKNENGEELNDNYLRELQTGKNVSGIFKIGDIAIIGSFVPVKLNSIDYQNILIFCHQIERELFLQDIDDQGIKELEEELRVNIESLQIAESTLRERLHNLE